MRAMDHPLPVCSFSKRLSSQNSIDLPEKAAGFVEALACSVVATDAKSSFIIGGLNPIAVVHAKNILESVYRSLGVDAPVIFGVRLLAENL